MPLVLRAPRGLRGRANAGFGVCRLWLHHDLAPYRHRNRTCTGVVLGQIEVDLKSNEMPAVRKLSGGLELMPRPSG